MGLAHNHPVILAIGRAARATVERLVRPDCSTRWAALFALVALSSGCTGLPEGVDAVRGFELERYLGKWYEIARLDHSFERGLQRVTAEYAARDDGGIDVVNRGLAQADGTWREARGKAYFVGTADTAHLKVSFFGPFYGAYVVFGLDQVDYRYAFVSGPDRRYLWLLARTPQVSEETRRRFVDRSRDLGFDVERLIFVDHPG